MRFIHLRRTLLWIFSLTGTLFKFWVKNPQHSLIILGFIIEKITASPRFFSKNVLIEKHSINFKKSLNTTTKLYKKYGIYFNPRDQKSYEKLEKVLSNKTQILYFLVRKLKPKIIVETGVAAGESTGNILQALKDNGFGKLYSIDLPFQWYIYGNSKLHLDSLPAGQSPGYLIPKNLKENWKLIIGNTYKTLPKLIKDLGEIDVFFHDSEHSSKTMAFEYKTSWPYIKTSGLLLSDDVSYTKAFNIFSKSKKMNIIVFKDIGILYKNG